MKQIREEQNGSPVGRGKDVGWTGEAIPKHRPGTSVRAVGSLGDPERSGGETGEWNWPCPRSKRDQNRCDRPVRRGRQCCWLRVYHDEIVRSHVLCRWVMMQRRRADN
jgi:hypothetical protein